MRNGWEVRWSGQDGSGEARVGVRGGRVSRNLLILAQMKVKSKPGAGLGFKFTFVVGVQTSAKITR